MADTMKGPNLMARQSNSGARHAERDAKLEALHERLAAAVDGLVSGEDWQRTVEFAARFRTRSAGRTGVFEVREMLYSRLSADGRRRSSRTGLSRWWCGG